MKEPIPQCYGTEKIYFKSDYAEAPYKALIIKRSKPMPSANIGAKFFFNSGERDEANPSVNAI